MAEIISTQEPGAVRVAREEAFVSASAGVTTADFTSSAIDVRGWEQIDLQITMEATGDPIGELYVKLGRSSDTATHGAISLDKVQSNNSAVTHSSGNANITVNDPAADAVINLSIGDLLDGYLSVFWDRTSGGAASSGILIAYTKSARTVGASR